MSRIRYRCLRVRCLPVRVQFPWSLCLQLEEFVLRLPTEGRLAPVVDLGDPLLILRQEPLRPQDDAQVAKYSWEVVEDAEQEEPDADDLHDRLRPADVVCEEVVGELQRRKRGAEALRVKAAGAGIEIATTGSVRSVCIGGTGARIGP